MGKSASEPRRVTNEQLDEWIADAHSTIGTWQTSFTWKVYALIELRARRSGSAELAEPMITDAQLEKLIRSTLRDLRNYRDWDGKRRLVLSALEELRALRK